MDLLGVNTPEGISSFADDLLLSLEFLDSYVAFRCPTVCSRDPAFLTRTLLCSEPNIKNCAALLPA
jgi:hypothetical protein